MITWNLDTTLYTLEQLEALYIVLESIDFSIAKQVQYAIENEEYKK